MLKEGEGAERRGRGWRGEEEGVDGGEGMLVFQYQLIDSLNKDK